MVPLSAPPRRRMNAPSLDRSRRSIESSRFKKPIDQMTPDELCQEAMRLREGLVATAEHLHAVYATLYTRVRRNPSEDAAPAYIAVANAGKRLSGMVLQGLRRAIHFDRVLVAAKQDLEIRARRERERQERQERKEAKEAERQSGRRLVDDPLDMGDSFEPMLQELLSGAGSSTSEDLDDLYGEEDV